MLISPRHLAPVVKRSSGTLFQRCIALRWSCSLIVVAVLSNPGSLPTRCAARLTAERSCLSRSKKNSPEPCYPQKTTLRSILG
jgi:hypothetical protein